MLTSITFTEEFKENFELLEFNKEIYSKLIKFLDRLRKDGFSIKSNNIKRLKKRGHQSRARLGKYRLIFRTLYSSNKIILLKIGARSDVYKKYAKESPEINDIKYLLNIKENKNNLTISDKPSENNIIINKNEFHYLDKTIKDNHSIKENEFMIEDDFLIDIHELYLIEVQEEYHKKILESQTIEELEKLKLPQNIIDRVTDYITNPNQNHLGKLYSLEKNESFSAISKRPLSEFMLSLDSQQNKVINKPFKYPLLVRGGAGTGKTLIGLYRLKKISEERVTESLFDSNNPTFLFMSYTNSLVNTCQEMSKCIFKSSNITFSTLDKFIMNSLNKFRRVEVSENNLEFRLRKMTMGKILESGDLIKIEAVNRVKERLGVPFLMEEIKTVIEANDIKTVDIYKNYSRIGRGKALRIRDRQAIWIVYEAYRNLCNFDNRYTWSGMRKLYLHLIETNQLIPSKVNSLVVDESQDLSIVSLRIITHLVYDPNFLLLLADTGQSIYNKNITWKNISPKLKFGNWNSIKLEKSYRMTKQISTALEALRNDADIDKTDIILNTYGVFDGDKPIFYRSYNKLHNEVVIKIVTEIVKKDKVNAGQIAIILRSLNMGSIIVKSLTDKGFKVDVFNKKTPLNITGNSIHIINAHAAKGLEFPYVIVPYVSDDNYPFNNSKPTDNQALEEWSSMEQRILYVALSRAQYKLWLISDKENPSRFLSRLNKKHWNIPDL